MPAWVPKKHLAPFEPDRDHASLCNVKARRWVGKKLVEVKVTTVEVEVFRHLPFSEACGRCMLSLYAREGTPVMRQ